MRLAAVLLGLFLTRIAFACPTCAPAQEAKTTWWALGPFMLLPFVVAGVVISLIKKHAKI
jgi:hypothetical protein